MLDTPQLRGAILWSEGKRVPRSQVLSPVGPGLVSLKRVSPLIARPPDTPVASALSKFLTRTSLGGANIYRCGADWDP